jgi:deoxyribonuclease V
MPDSATTPARRRVDDAIEIPDLYGALSHLLGQVPAGRVTTYGALAEALGAVVAARWVASFLVDPAGPQDLPRHRVVLRDGALGKFPAGGQCEKKRLLAAEGVIAHDHTVDLAKYLFRDFESSRPLFGLQQVQERLFSRLRLQSPDAIPEFVAGVDVSYVGRSHAGPIEGFAAYALIEVKTGKLVWSTTVRDAVGFPYIPGFLAFRELPILRKLLTQVRRRDRLAEVVLVDGNGVLHQRHAGIASHLGIVADVVTIGIGKSLLCGTVDHSRLDEKGAVPVIYQGETVASAMQGEPGAQEVYVSPGHLVDLPFATNLTRRLFRGHRVPEPIFHAHAVSRAAARDSRK